MQLYANTINRQLIQRLQQDLKKFKPQDNLCSLLGIDKDDIDIRNSLFTCRRLKIRSVLQAKLIIEIEIDHNARTHKIEFFYDDRVGRIANGKRVYRKFAALPEFRLELVLERYEEIIASFTRGENWFEKAKENALDNDTLQDQYPKWLSSRKAEVDLNQLDIKTHEGDVGRWNNHLIHISLKDGSLFSKRSLKSITRRTIIELKDQLMTTLAFDPKKKRYYTRGASVVNRCLHNLKGFYEWAEDREIINEGTNPCYNLKYLDIPPRTKKLEFVELGRFMNYLMTTYDKSSDRVKVAIYLLWITGQRITEILKIKWSDLIIDETDPAAPKRILMIRNKKGKRKNDNTGKNMHAVYLTEATEKLIRSLPRLEHNDYIFWTNRVNKHGREYMCATSANAVIKQVCKKLGMEHFAPHDIKRSLITHDINAYGMDAVKRQTGNKSERVINETYDQSILEDNVDSVFLQKSKELQEMRELEIESFANIPLETNNVFTLIQKKTPAKVAQASRRERYRKKIFDEYGMSPSQYHKRKKEGYYDKKA